MKVMMVGAGAVGGFFGAKLARAGVDCSFLLRSRTLEAVRKRGLTVKSPDSSFTVYPLAADDPCKLPAADLVVLSVKRYDLEAALQQLRPVLNARTTLLTLQNGVDTEARIQELLPDIPDVPIVGGVAYIYSKIAEPGIIEHYKKGALAIGQWTGASLAPQSIQSLFDGAGVKCQIVKDIQLTKWEKMCWNVVFNPLTVLIDDQVSKALLIPELRVVIERTVEETLAIAKREGIDLASDMAERIIQWSQEIRDIHTSMYDDWKAGRPTEIDYLNGYLVRRGKTLGIATPVNEIIVALVKAITEPIPAGPAVLRLDGQVIQPIVLDVEALAKLPAEAQVANAAPLARGMRGVRVKALLDVATPVIGADHVTFHSADAKFAASLSLKEAADTGILIYLQDNEPLPMNAGGPFRLLTPGLGDLCANVKGVFRMEFTKGRGKDTRPSGSPQHSEPPSRA